MALVLVADDDPDTLFLLRLNLELAGHRVLTARGMEQALSHFAAIGVDAVVMGATMPFRTGIRLLEAIRTFDRRPDVPVLVLTPVPVAERPHHDHERCDEYVTSPFGFSKLVPLIEDLIARIPVTPQALSAS